MSVARCLEINARLRAAGVVVREAPGWQSRGNGQASAYEGGLIHHTATAFGIAWPGTGVGNLLINGRGEPNPLAGPLCNYAGNVDGSLTIIAAHPANHAGASGGRSMGPLPVTRDFNRRVLGLEIVYPGTEPMKDVQYRSALVWARVVADVVGHGDIERVRAHAETSITGKWDPGYAPGKTIDMTAFRRDALEEDMTPEQLLDYKIKRHGSVLGGETSLRAVLANFDRSLELEAARDRATAAAITALSNNPDIDPEALQAFIRAEIKANTPTAAQNAAALRPLLEEVMRDVIPDEQADQIIRRLAEKLGDTEGN